MGKVLKFELNREGVRQLMTSPAMMSICEAKAKAMLAKLGGGYTMTTHTGRNRVNAEVATDSPAARQENLDKNTILKALGAAR